MADNLTQNPLEIDLTNAAERQLLNVRTERRITKIIGNAAHDAAGGVRRIELWKRQPAVASDEIQIWAWHLDNLNDIELRVSDDLYFTVRDLWLTMPDGALPAASSLYIYLE